MIPHISLPLRWTHRDARLIICARGIRTFAQGALAVLIGLYLHDELGFSLGQVGFFLSTGIVGAGVLAFLVGFVAGRLGRRRLLVLFSLVSAAAGLSLLLAESFPPLVLLAFIGSFSSGASGEGPVQPIEMASLPSIVSDERRTDLFAIYGIIARFGVALGALAAGLPELFQDYLGLGSLWSFKVMFIVFAACQVTGALIYSRLSTAVEGEGASTSTWTNPLKLPSRRLIFTLTGLFGVDTFATALLIQPLIAFWFADKFGIDLGSIALIFALSHFLSAISLWLSAKIANRIGLLNTVVFTQIPASILLIAAAFAPTALLAVIFWQARAFLGQMDVPARDSYIMSVVGPEERVSMASVTFVGRSISGAAAPSAASGLWSAVSASAPFIACAVLKTTYDIFLLKMFSNTRPPEEERRMQERAARTQ